MYEMTLEQLATIPLGTGNDHQIINRMIRLAVTSKRKAYPELWGESTAERPIINLKQLFDGVIIGGELSFFAKNLFITFKYTRTHSVDVERYKTNSGDGVYHIDCIWIGNSPHIHRRAKLGVDWRTSRSLDMRHILYCWDKHIAEMKANG